MYAMIVSLRVRAAMRETFLAAAHANAEASVREEPGCLRFDISEAVEDASRFAFYELYRDLAAFEVHRQTSHFHSWRAAGARCLQAEGGQENWQGSTVWSVEGSESSAAPGHDEASPLADKGGAHVVIRSDAISAVDRGAGVRTLPYVGRWNTSATRLTSGVTMFVPGTGLPLHTHNVEEQVLVLEGEAEVEIGDHRVQLGPGDSTWAPAGVAHRFATRTGHSLRIFWVYGGDRVTRTVCATGETVEHLSGRDKFGSATG